MSNKQYTVELLIANWNDNFPDHKLSAEDLKKPHALMAAVFKAFDRLSICTGIRPPSEKDRNENIRSYWDLVPVINTTRMINHLVLDTQPNSSTACKITQFLQPAAATSYSMLLLLYNLILFWEERSLEISPYEDELFSKIDEVQKLKDKKNCLMGLLNEQLVAKAERATRVKKIDNETKQLEEELKQEKEAFNKGKQVLAAKQKESRQMQIMQEQKKDILDKLYTEKEKVRSLRVYDAEDIRAQVELAAQNDQEAEQRLNKLRVTLMEKEDRLKNLQAIKPNLDIANNLLHKMTQALDSLKDYESGDVEIKAEEVEELSAELRALEAQWAECSAAHAQASAKRSEAAQRRQQELEAAHRSIQECEENDKKSAEKCEKAAQIVTEIKNATVAYHNQKTAHIKELENIEKEFVATLELINEAVLVKMEGAKEEILRYKK